MMQGRQSVMVEAASQKVRLYSVAKELGLENRELVDRIRGMGIEVKNHMSFITNDDVQRLRRSVEKERTENQQVKRLSATVIRRRSKGAKPSAAQPVVAPPPPPRRPVVEPPPARPEVRVQEEVVQAVAPEPPVVEKIAVEKPMPVVVEAQPKVVEAAKPIAVVAPVFVEPVVEEPPAVAEVAVAPPPVVEAVVAPEVVEEVVVAPPPAPRKATEPAVPDPGVEEVFFEPGDDGEEKPIIRYAPGFEPGGKFARARAARQARVASGQTTARPSGGGHGHGGTPGPVGPPQALSAAEVARMMAGAGARPRVVITDLDARRQGLQTEARKAAGRFARAAPNQRRSRRKRVPTSRTGRKTEITMPAEHKRVIRLEDAIAVGELGRQMGAKSTDVLKTLWGMGLTNITITQSVDADTASLLAAEFGYEVENVAFREDQVIQEFDDKDEDLLSRAPVVTVMGHVDHGKTSLLDAIRGASAPDVADGEAGGITQHVGAYRVPTPTGDVVFLDTPGHEAFTSMRARGAQCTDIVVLVVAADDGVMPQTAEAIDHARDAGVPIIVAVNKMDLPNANPDLCKKALAERNLMPEDWGGDTQFVHVSAKTKAGIPELLESIVLQSEMLDLKANPERQASGTVIEARLDRARGPMASVLVQEGTLKVGETVVAGEFIGKVRALINDQGRQVKTAGPSTPVEILGLSGVPRAGDMFNALADEKAARTLVDHRSKESRRRGLANSGVGRTLEDILGQLRAGEIKELKVLLKADVQGSAEAVRDALQKLSTEKVTVNVISAGVGGITETDVNLAKAAGAVLMGFNVRTAGKASKLAEREGVEARLYDVIYEMMDEVKELMRGLLPKERREKPLGRVEVRETYTIPKQGVIAGCAVLEGKITRKAQLRLVRDNVKIHEGRIGSLRRFKEDVKEVSHGYECGISIVGHNDIKVGDIIEGYEVEELPATL